jgi:hypothetical protein
MASDAAPATFWYSQAGATALGAVVRMAGSLKVPEAYAESIIGFDR